MRVTTPRVHNNQDLEIFMRQPSRLDGRFEVWLVSPIKGQRTVLDHLITQEDLEQTLFYSQKGDVTWENGNENAIPSQKTQIAQQNEELLKSDALSNDAILRCYNAIHQLPIDRKAWNAAKKFLIGQWTDGKATLRFEPNSRLELNYPVYALHPHFVRVAAHSDGADWWNFSRWWLLLMNDAKMQGQKIGVCRCDEQELHIFSSEKEVLVHVFYRYRDVELR